MAKSPSQGVSIPPRPPGGRCSPLGWAAPRSPVQTLRLLYLKHRYQRQGDPGDAAQLVPAVTEVMVITRRPPGAVAGDRGFGAAANDTALAASRPCPGS